MDRWIIWSTDSGVPYPWKLTKMSAILTCRDLNREARKQDARVRYYPQKYTEPKYNNFPEFDRTERTLEYLS